MEKLPLPVLGFAERAGRWTVRSAATEPRPMEPETLSVITLNTWFAPDHRATRIAGLLALLDGLDVDLVCLQEVVPELLNRLLETSWVREEAEVVTSGSVIDGYGQLIVSRLPLRRAWEIELPSLMNRSLLCVELSASSPWVVSTTHLESTRQLSGSRVEQLSQVFDALRPYPRAMLMGDFNFDPADPEEASLERAYMDAWAALRPQEPGYTEDTTLNHMRYRRRGRHKHVRYDRVLARLPGWRPTEVALFATEALEPDVFVSDHFGVAARYESVTK